MSDQSMSDKQYARFVSASLKAFGFRHGAPLHRATADFTIDQVFQGLRPGRDEDSPNLTFHLRTGDAAITMRAMKVRNLRLDGLTALLIEMFGERWLVGGDENCLVIEGSLYDADREDFVAADAYDRGEPDHYPWPLALPDPDFHIAVVAVVSFSRDGRVLDAIVQRVPSPADEILTIPPM